MPRLQVVEDGYASAYEGVGDAGYDVDRFYVRSTDTHHHVTETRVKMPPDIYAGINRLIASGDLGGTPIDGYAPFMRDAAVHNLHRLARVTKSPAVAALAQRQRHLADIEQAAAEAESLRKMVHDADERTNAACKAGDTFHVAQLVTMYEVILMDLREPYASELEDILEDARRWLRAH